MKKLKLILLLVYVIIIILLLLSRCQCDGHNEFVSDEDSIPTKIPIKEKFNADVVMCIDCTGSMEHIISTIKNNAISFYPDLKGKCLSKGKQITSMRIMVIGFRDHDTQAIERSDFFEMPDNEKGFKEFVSSLSARGGGSAPELGYDALAKAICSDWRNSKDVHQIVILWTDAPSHPLSGTFGTTSSIGELQSHWREKMNPKGKRLILFAPNDNTWTNIETIFDNTSRHDVNAGKGLTDVDYDEIINTLSETI